MNEDEFWPEFTRRCNDTGWFTGTTLENAYCDGFGPKSYAFDGSPFEITGTVGFLSRGIEEWTFVLKGVDSFSSFADVRWSDLLPAENATSEVRIDKAARMIQIDLASR